ncbi:MAG: CheR family methyltransferase [Acidobacteriota bacterium]
MSRKHHSHLNEIEQAIASHFGWKITDEWREKLALEVKRKAEKLQVDEAEYCLKAAHTTAELEVLADLLSHNETRFFREREQIHTLSQQVIPQLIAARAPEKILNVWSAACSTGEEAYTIAMLICEAIPANEKWQVHILATDLRGKAILTAMRGAYPASALVLIDPLLRERYFSTAAGNGQGSLLGYEQSFDVVRELKEWVTFRRANLYDQNFWRSLRQQFDLIVCNNLLMHFHPIGVHQTVERLAKSLNRGGVLTVIKGEGMFIDHSSLKRDQAFPGNFFVKK